MVPMYALPFHSFTFDTSNELIKCWLTRFKLRFVNIIHRKKFDELSIVQSNQIKLNIWRAIVVITWICFLFHFNFEFRIKKATTTHLMKADKFRINVEKRTQKMKRNKRTCMWNICRSSICWLHISLSPSPSPFPSSSLFHLNLHLLADFELYWNEKWGKPDQCFQNKIKKKRNILSIKPSNT